MRVTLEAVVGFVNRNNGTAVTKVTTPARLLPARKWLRSDGERPPVPALAAHRRRRGAEGEPSTATRQQVGRSTRSDVRAFRLEGGQRAALSCTRRHRPRSRTLPWLATASRPSLDRVRIAQIELLQRLQLVVQLVDQRHAGRDVQLDDLLARRRCPDTSPARAGCCRARRSGRACRRGCPARSSSCQYGRKRATVSFSDSVSGSCSRCEPGVAAVVEGWRGSSAVSGGGGMS